MRRVGFRVAVSGLLTGCQHTHAVYNPTLLGLPPTLAQSVASGEAIFACAITAEGLARDCDLERKSGDPAVANAAKLWLADPGTRFVAASSGAVQHRIQVALTIDTQGHRVIMVSEDPQLSPKMGIYYLKGSMQFGTVQLRFDIGPDGRPEHGRIAYSTANESLAQYALSWLQSSCVHFRPDIDHGTAVRTFDRSLDVTYP